MKKQTKKIRKTQEGEKRKKKRRKKKRRRKKKKKQKKQQKQKELFRLSRGRKHRNNECMTCNSSVTLQRLTGHEVRDRPFG